MSRVKENTIEILIELHSVVIYRGKEGDLKPMVRIDNNVHNNMNKKILISRYT